MFSNRKLRQKKLSRKNLTGKTENLTEIRLSIGKPFIAESMQQPWQPAFGLLMQTVVSTENTKPLVFKWCYIYCYS